MGAYQINPNLLDASISRDTRGYADGIIGAGNAIGGALQAYGQRQWQTQDANRNHDWQMQRDSQQHEWAVAQDERNFQQGMTMQDRGFKHQESMQQTAQERAKQEKQDEADGQLFAALRGYREFIPEKMDALAQEAKTPAQKKSMAEVITNYGAAQLRAHIKTQERQDEYNFDKEHPPQAWAIPGVGEAEGITMYGVDKNVMGSIKPEKPKAPPPAGFAPVGWNERDGVQMGMPKPPPVKKINGADMTWNGTAWVPIEGATPPGARPSKTASDYFGS